MKTSPTIFAIPFGLFLYQDEERIWYVAGVEKKETWACHR